MWSRIMLMCIFVGSILPASEMFVDDDGDDIFGEDVEAEDNRSSTSGGRFRQVLKSCDFVFQSFHVQKYLVSHTFPYFTFLVSHWTFLGNDSNISFYDMFTFNHFWNNGSFLDKSSHFESRFLYWFKVQGQRKTKLILIIHPKSWEKKD